MATTPRFSDVEVPETPRIVSPRTIAVLWVLVGLLLLGGLVTWRVSVPLVVDGVVVERSAWSLLWKEGGLP